MKKLSGSFLLSLVLALICITVLSAEWAAAQGNAARTSQPAPLHTVNQAPHAQATAVPRPTLDPTRMPLANMPLATMRAELTATIEPTATPTTARSTPTSTPTARITTAPGTSRQPHFQQYVPQAGHMPHHRVNHWWIALVILLLFGGGCLVLASKRYNT
jgi:hypothetical protein